MIIEHYNTIYEGLFAQYYDLLHPYRTDIPFYVDMARLCEPPVLEIGSGTGRVLLPIAQAGIPIHGVEPALSMNSILEEKISPELRPLVQIHPHSIFTLESSTQFGLIILAANTFRHFTSLHEQRHLLQILRQWLKPGGALIIDITLANLEEMVLQNNQSHTFEFEYNSNQARIELTQMSTYHFLQQEEHLNLTLVESLPGQTKRKAVASINQTFFLRRELINLIECSGFSLMHVWEDYMHHPATELSTTLIIQAV
jgi:SAM-dependent methyltransferase